MHLVVLKRNNIDVPETLPPILKPAYLRQRLSKANRKVVLKPSVPNHNKDLYNGRDATTPSNPESLNASLLNNQDDELEHAKADKKELNDATDTASIISSPGIIFELMKYLQLLFGFLEFIVRNFQGFYLIVFNYK